MMSQVYRYLSFYDDLSRLVMMGGNKTDCTLRKSVAEE